MATTKALLSAFADSFPGFWTETPGEQLGLYCALARQVVPAVVKHYLDDQKVHVDYRHSGNTVLHVICMRAAIRGLSERLLADFADIVALLIERGADVNARACVVSCYAHPPLFLALARNSGQGYPIRIVRALLHAGADPHAKIGYYLSKNEVLWSRWSSGSNDNPFDEGDVDVEGNSNSGDTLDSLDDFSCDFMTSQNYWSSSLSDDERLAEAMKLNRFHATMTVVETLTPITRQDVRDAVSEAAAWSESLQHCWIATCLQFQY